MTDTAAPQPSNFTASFAIRVHALHTTTIESMTGVIKKVEWTMQGAEQGQTFELPKTTDLSDPQPELFIPLEQVSETHVVDWIHANETRMPGFKAHIQTVLDEKIARAALTPARLPWLESSQAAPAAELTNDAQAPAVARAA